MDWDTTIHIRCPQCSYKLKQSLQALKQRSRVTCVVCDSTVRLKVDEIRMRDAEDALGRLCRSIETELLPGSRRRPWRNN